LKRQEEILNGGKTPVQETRGWDEDKQKTVTQRIKEEANDYRYFPEPDIPPIRFTQNQISNIKSQIPELPDLKLTRFINEYGLFKYYAEILTREKEVADYFEETIRASRQVSSIKYQVLSKKNDSIPNTKYKIHNTKLEGCLSLPNIWGEIARKPSITLSYLDKKGKNHTKTFKGLFSVIIQHEVDHLNGILFPKKVLEQKGKLYKSHKNEKGEDVFEKIEI
jgi:Glu-tRNA(Gln) amidotransferase subunit E-like FAD-binding protein